MIQQNGHADRPPRRTTEEGTPSGVRSGLILIERLIKQGAMAPDAAIDAMAWAKKMRDDPAVNARVRARCNETLASIARHIHDKAVDLDKLHQGSDGTDIRIVLERIEGQRMWTRDE